MVVVDTHVHVIAPDQRKYPRTLSGAHSEWVRETSAEHLIEVMDAAGVDRTVLVQAHGAYGYDNSYAADAALAYPDRFAGVAIVDPLRDDAAGRLNYWVTERAMRGLRLFALTEPAGEWLDDPRTFPLWELAESLHIPICVCAPMRQVPRLMAPLERFPRVAVALDHAGLPRLDDGPPYAAARPLFDLARYPNLYLKLSSVTLYAAARGASTARDFIGRLVDRYGARRIMWGTNYPATHDRGFVEQVDLARRELEFLGHADRQAIMGGTALALWPGLR
ncbi:MAG: amidohydrolase [Candidatus Binataceae bacterium]|nr:amidohydrolase [Candidatus Binataceae bacterium]